MRFASTSIISACALFVLGAAAASHAANSVASSTPQQGDVAPAFTLPSQSGSTDSLAQFRGKWVVLYFYPVHLFGSKTH